MPAFDTSPPKGRGRIVKKHNIIIERWPGNPGPSSERGTPGFRWTVSYEKEGRFYGQGFEDTHAAARAAAERFLIDQGVDLNWLPPGHSEAMLEDQQKKPLRRRA